MLGRPMVLFGDYIMAPANVLIWTPCPLRLPRRWTVAHMSGLDDLRTMDSKIVELQTIADRREGSWFRAEGVHGAGPRDLGLLQASQREM